MPSVVALPDAAASEDHIYESDDMKMAVKSNVCLYNYTNCTEKVSDSSKRTCNYTDDMEGSSMRQQPTPPSVT
jgi:hypothetical protein